MFLSSQTQAPGQSWTLDVKTDPSTRETVVKCDACPDVGEVRDADSRYAVQEMRRRLDDHVARGYQEGRRPLMIGRGELLDDDR